MSKYTCRDRAIKERVLLGVCILLILLVGCNTSSSPGIQPGSITQQLSTTSTASPVSSTDWTTYHHDNARTGFVEHALDPHQLTRTWSVSLDGAVYAEPLVIGGRVIVATEHNSVYALDRNSGQVQWQTTLGNPVALSTLPCGNIDPLGITGTPVYDPATGLVFAVAEIQGPAHILVGVDVTTGQVRVRRSVDLPTMEPRVHQQRAALALSHDMVYIAYGGLSGDCGNYLGTVVASRTDGSGPLLSYQVPTPHGGGIWAPSGPAVDVAGHLYIAVGNGATTQGKWDQSDSVLRLSPTLQQEDGFAPSQWQQDNATDADLGSMGPVLLPGELIFADGKSGLGYLLHADALGGIGGQAQVQSICAAFGGAAVLGSQVFVPCIDGLRQVVVGPGANLNLGWRASASISGSPVIGGHTVYCVDPAGTLYAFDAANGVVRAMLSVGATSHFATPTLSGNQVFVGTLTGVVAATIV